VYAGWLENHAETPLSLKLGVCRLLLVLLASEGGTEARRCGVVRAVLGDGLVAGTIFG